MRHGLGGARVLGGFIAAALDGLREPRTHAPRHRKHVVIVGGGFAGVRVARALASEDLDVTLIDRRNHHLFQPLLYQVACAGLSPDDIAVPLRRLVRAYANARVLMGEVENVDFERQCVRLSDGAKLGYDYLVLAAGAAPNYHGHDEWQGIAPPLKSLDAALRLRARVLLAFERAEREPDEDVRRKLLSFVVAGGGPTGVELGGALAELGRLAVPPEYARVAASDVRVTIVEKHERILAAFDPRASRAAQDMLEQLGVRVRCNASVREVGEEFVDHDAGRLDAGVIAWASGVKPVALASRLDVERDARGRVIVAHDCSLPDHAEVFAIGDIAACERYPGGPALPALAAVAVQQGEYVAQAVARDLRRRARKPFRYRDRGMLATVGRGRAVADLGSLQLHGGAGWWLWSLVHIYQLMGMRNRAKVLLDWAWQYATPGRRAGARIILGQPKRDRLAAVQGTNEPDEQPSARVLDETIVDMDSTTWRVALELRERAHHVLIECDGDVKLDHVGAFPERTDWPGSHYPDAVQQAVHALAARACSWG